MEKGKQTIEALAVIAGLTEDFDCVSYADLRSNTIRDYRVDPALSEAVDGWDETENYIAKMMLFANALVGASDREALLNRVTADAVRAQFAKRPVFYVDTRVILNGKERMYQLKFVADAENEDHAIIGFHNISEAVAKHRQEILNNVAMNGLASDFECVAYAELAENRVTVCRICELFAKYIPGWRTVTDYAVRVRLLADALVIEEDRDRFLLQTSPEQIMKGVAEGQAYYVAFRILHENEVKFYQIKYILDPNNKNCVVLGVHNIDFEKKLEMERYAQEDAAKVKSDFLTRMSQDILSPLASIRKGLELARENISDAEILQRSMEKAIVTSEYLYGLVNDVLNITSDRGDGTGPVREPMNMRLFVEHCCDAVEGQMNEKNIRLVRFIDDIAHPCVRSDAPRLRQIILNLLNNAVKFTPRGGQVTFRVSELTATDASATFKFDITDTGAGMDRRILEHIWDVLAKRADTSTPDNTGTGLGLAVCKMLADMLGATISVDSKVGEGSCFSVLLPMELDPEAYSGSGEEDASILNGMHILAADDNELSLNFITELLRDSGAIITQAENGKRALELFRGSVPGEIDAVLMDSVMPEMDGIEATRAIRALPRADSATVTIIGMSTGISAENMAAFRNAGISAYVEKPVQIPVLVNALLTCSHNRSQILEKELAVANESSLKDALTGMRNRTAYERAEVKLNREIAAGTVEPFAFLFCDVNDLKLTNDTYGHERGDELIRSACRQICDVFKHSSVFRMGGDEFAAILYGADYDKRDALLERMAPTEAYGGVSIACGMAVFDPQEDRDLRSVYKRADAAMYEHKRKIKQTDRK